MGPKKTVPYATVDERRDLPFTGDLELASLFVLAEARREMAPLSAMARVYYPFHIHSREGGVLLIDLLGLNRASVKYRIIPDVDDFEKALDAASQYPDAFREALKNKGNLFKEFAGQRTLRINGLIVRPGKSEELSDLLENTSDLDTVDEPFIFKPTLRSDDIESIIGSIRSLGEDIEGDLKSLERAKRSLMDALDASMKALEEEIQDIRDRGSKVKARRREEFEEAKGRYKKTLGQKLKEIREDYKKQVAPFTKERKNTKGKLARRRRKLDLLKADEDDPAAAEGLLREIQELEARFEEADSAIRPLMAWRDSEVEEARARDKADIRSEADKIKDEEAGSRGEVQRRKAEISELEAAAKGVAARVDRLIRSKKGKLRSLSRLCFDVEAETADLYVPFYIFHYGGKKFDFYAPVVVSSAKGFLSRFRRMLVDNLRSKMAQLIKPRTEFMERYLAKAVKTLGRDGDLAVAYRRAGDGLNLLKSREAVYKIMVGLVKIRREGWISDGEYIRLQEVLVENLGLISCP